MKNVIIYSLILILLGSCGMSNNFNSQKFTSLKKIKPEKTEIISIEQTENEVSNNYLVSENNSEAKSSNEEAQTNLKDDPLSEDVLPSNHNQIQEIKNGKTNFPSTPLKINKSTDEKAEKTADEKKEDNMFWWMMTMFLLAAPATLFVIIPAIPFYITAFILAILLIRRINTTPLENQTQRQKRRKGFAIWVLVQWAIGLGIFYIALRLF